MDNHRKKMIAPVIITIIVVIYYIAFFCAIIYFTGGILRVLLGVIPLALAICMIWTCVQRLKEIKGGEEDDLGKY